MENQDSSLINLEKMNSEVFAFQGIKIEGGELNSLNREGDSFSMEVVKSEEYMEQEAPAKYEEEDDQEMTIEKHEALEDISFGKCNASYTTEEYAQSYNACERFKLDSQEKEDLTINDKQFQCEECGTFYKLKNSFDRHVQRVHKVEKPFKCSECDFSFALKRNLTWHENTVHYKDKPIKCEECQFSCKTKRDLKIHVLAVHCQEKPFKCSECDHTCYGKQTMTIHVRTIHGKKKLYICNECQYSGTTRLCLKNHVLAVHCKARPFKCSICDSSFTLKNNMTKHLRVVHGNYNKVSSTLHHESPMILKETQAQYELEDEQEITIEKHEILEDSIYDKCDMTYPTEKHAKSAHVSEKPKLDGQENEELTNNDKQFKCEECVTFYKHKTSFDRHAQRVHTEEKPFKCSACDHSFAMKRYLALHEKAVHYKENPLKCKECGIVYKVISCFKNHVRNVHCKENPLKYSAVIS